MKKYYICNNNGKIVGSGFTNKDAVKKLKEDDNIFFSNDKIDDVYHDFQSGNLKKRPKLPHDSHKVITKNENYILTDIPKNTIIHINGIDCGIIDDGKLLTSFPVAMQYKIELIPPFPYHTKIITVEVKNG